MKLISIFFLLIVLGFCYSDISVADSSQTQREILEIDKLQQEVLKLQQENDNIRNPWRSILSNPTWIASFVALLGVFVTLWKQLSESRRQQELDRRQRELDREQRETESRRDIDKKFTSNIASIGSNNEALQASAFVSIVTFLKPEYKSLHDQVFSILVANLKLHHSEQVGRLVVDAFEKALHRKIEASLEIGEELKLDLSRAKLIQANLSNLNLAEIDLGFSNLKLANLSGSSLFRARAYEADFTKARISRVNLSEARMQGAKFIDAYLHECNLVASDLKNTDLSGAQFFQSKMQSSHLEGANISGARFESANIADAYFSGVTADRRALESLLKAKNWKKAHFDNDTKIKLEEIAQEI